MNQMILVILLQRLIEILCNKLQLQPPMHITDICNTDWKVRQVSLSTAPQDKVLAPGSMAANVITFELYSTDRSLKQLYLSKIIAIPATFISFLVQPGSHPYMLAAVSAVVARS